MTFLAWVRTMKTTGRTAMHSVTRTVMLSCVGRRRIPYAPGKKVRERLETMQGKSAISSKRLPGIVHVYETIPSHPQPISYNIDP